MGDMLANAALAKPTRSQKWAQNRFFSETPEEAAGRLLMIGWEGRDSGEIRDLIDEFRPGGLIFFRRNYPLGRPAVPSAFWPEPQDDDDDDEPWGYQRPGPQEAEFWEKQGLGPQEEDLWERKPAAQLPRRAADLDILAPGYLREILVMIQKYALRTLDRPLIIAVDQEGGKVSRLPESFFQLPSAREMSMLELERVKLLGARAGRELRSSGFNLNLAPVLDLDWPEGGYIGNRSFGSDPAQVISYAQAFQEGLWAGGVLSCGKHFPGLGGATLDPHERAPEIGWDQGELARSLKVFQALVEAGLPAVMTTHAYYPALDPNELATLSAPIVSVLRQEMGFEGLLLTDDLEMGAVIGSMEPGRVAVRAVLAGHDLVLVCRHHQVIREAYEALLEAINKNRISYGHLLESGVRLQRFLKLLSD
ncbi:MAG: hypothetical protein LBR11_04910 [Deltaproteobacteria bacterium]|jgi:beta-N-acetylhexosaminidase|nr:hypothetical protein [Deltaproteobacteria bacterium]